MTMARCWGQKALDALTTDATKVQSAMLTLPMSSSDLSESDTSLLIYFCETAWTHAYQSALVTLIIFLGFQFLGVSCIWWSSRPHLPSVLKRFHTCPWPVNEIPTTAVTVTVIAKAGTEKSKPWIKFRIDWSLCLCQPTLEIYALRW